MLEMAQLRPPQEQDQARARIRAVIAARNLSQKLIAAKIGLTSVELTNRISGNARTALDDEVAEKLRQEIKMPAGWPWHDPANVSMLAVQDAPAAVQYVARGDKVVIPLWRFISAGLDDECSYMPSGEAATFGVSAFLTGGDWEHHVVCSVSGTSMAPRILQGDYVVMRLNPNPAPNTIVVARNPDGRNYLKVLRVSTSGMHLESINEEFPAIKDVKGWVLVGEAVGIFSPNPDPGRNIEWLDGRPLRA